MTNDQNHQQPEKKYLDSYTFAAVMLRKHPDCSYSTAIIYSYMLCRYNWFNSMGKQFFESTTEIADSCSSKDATVRLAIKWLKKEGYLDVGKKKGMMHNNNTYIVHDKFSLYKNFETNIKKEPPKPKAPASHYVNWDEDPPF